MHIMSALFQFTSNCLSVDDAAQLLKRLYWAERELFRATAALDGYVVD